MKKFIAAILAVVFCFSFAACNSAEDLDAQASKTAMELYMQEHQAEYDSMAASMSAAGVTMKFSARGDSLVLGAKMDMEIDENLKEAMATATAYSLEESKQSFLSILDAVREAVPSAKSIVVEFYDSKDSLIVSKEFFAE